MDGKSTGYLYFELGTCEVRSGYHMVRKRNQKLIGSMALVCAVVLLLTQGAHAGFVLTVDDLSTSGVDVIVGDEAAVGTPTAKGLTTHLDGAAGTPGLVTFAGLLPKWDVLVSAGSIAPVIGPDEMDLFASVLSRVENVGTAEIIISLTATGFGGLQPSFTSDLGGVTDGVVVAEQIRDFGDKEFALNTGGPVYTIEHGQLGLGGAFSETKSLATGVPGGTWSFTESVAVSSVGGGELTTFNMNSSVPLPAAVLCVFGFPLVAGRGMSRLVRRRVV